MSGTNKQTRGKREWRSPNKVKERYIPKFIRKRYIDKLILGEGDTGIWNNLEDWEVNEISHGHFRLWHDKLINVYTLN